MSENCYTREQIEKTMKSKGYKWFEDNSDRGYDVNIVGVRNSSTKEVTNKYDDCITISYKIDGEWKFNCWVATTDPGTYWMNHPMNKLGCAILVPGQYRSSHKIRLHRGKYEALGQQKRVKVYRDGDLDNVYDHDEGSIKEGLYGINIHRSNAYRATNIVNKYSAGCQVFSDPDDFDDFMEICREARDVWGNSFTYTLIESKDID